MTEAREVTVSESMLEPGALARIERELPEILAHYRAHGWARLGKVIADEELEKLRTRADEIMLGTVRHQGLFFQHDSPSGDYEDLVLGEGWVRPSLDYRKIEKLEKDPIYRAYLSNPLFELVARAWIDDADIHGVSLYRAVLFSKGPRGGTYLPWHQDGGEFWGIDRPATLQLWTALDDAPLDGGALEFVDESHLRGLATPNGGVVPDNKLAEVDIKARSVMLPATAGEVILVHNFAWHRSARSETGKPRRALTACLMSGATRCLRKKRAPREFFRVFPPR